MGPKKDFTKESMSQQKLSYSLIVAGWLAGMVKVLTFGAFKYDRNNWSKCKEKELHLYWDALYRHLEAYRAGEMVDEETGISHMSHAACNIMFIQSIKEKLK